MKKIFLVLSLSLAVVLTTAARPATKEDPRAEQAFSKLFAGASHVKWEETKEGLTKVSFVWGDHRTIAYFDAKAELVGTIRGLFFKKTEACPDASGERGIMNSEKVCENERLTIKIIQRTM